MEKTCRKCKNLFEARGEWQLLCYGCWKENRGEMAQLQSENERLKKRNVYLERATQTHQFNEKEIMDLIILCHPDKHNNSPFSNEVTKKLLAIRRNFKG